VPTAIADNPAWAAAATVAGGIAAAVAAAAVAADDKFCGPDSNWCGLKLEG